MSADRVRELEMLRGERNALERALERYPGIFDAGDAARLAWLRREIADREEVLPSWLRRT
jgi:hypothetical protein